MTDIFKNNLLFFLYAHPVMQILLLEAGVLAMRTVWSYLIFHNVGFVQSTIKMTAIQ